MSSQLSLIALFSEGITVRRLWNAHLAHWPYLIPKILLRKKIFLNWKVEWKHLLRYFVGSKKRNSKEQ
jgi:hypothetical protein